MRIPGIITAVAAAIAISTGTASADDEFEKCKVVKDGKNLVKYHNGDCASSLHSCANLNKAHDPDAWILVPKGLCKKINAGNFTGVDKAIKDKIDVRKPSRQDQ